MALSQKNIRRWYLVHKWTSLVVTAFLLMFCLTGLPLIFHHEIDDLTRAPVIAAQVEARPVNLDAIGRRAVAEQPGWHMMFLTWDPDKPIVSAVIAPSMAADESQVKILPFDARSGERLHAPPADEGVMAFLLDLHSHLLLGIPGQLFLGLIGLVFMVAIVSGVVVYAPFMRKLAFGTVRKDRSKRVKWLDTHNMIGIVTLGWISVVGLTGFIITMTLPITMIWQMDELAEMAAPYKDAKPPARLAPVDAAVARVRAAVPDGRVSFVAWPGSQFSTQHHYMIGLSGKTPLTERLIRPALVDAATGRLTDLREMPWYVKTLFLSVPLHFGDYGGMPLKIIWALLDIAAIIVLISGLYLWLGRRRVPLDKRVAELSAGGVTEG
ncbi:PepSY-associated TM helix domain-containing protein [Sphingomonas sp.]|uniref:PepSY-associated TM helix domain-containing protein n=1 Tax=Sphingomonas sp. TaxID=28214 RepID=UPI003D6D7121